MELPGSTSNHQQDVKEPRAYVIRLPGAFLGLHHETLEHTCYQTVVVAQNEFHAWDLASDCDVWETLPFPVDQAQIFPKDLPKGDAPVPDRRS